jgi:hypothetical protein
VHERARLAREPDLGRSQRVPGLIVTQLEADEVDGRSRGEPGPAVGLVVADVQGEQQFERLGEVRPGDAVALPGEPPRERVKQHIDEPRWIRARHGRPRGLRRLAQRAGSILGADPVGGHERFQMCLSCQRGVG